MHPAPSKKFQQAADILIFACNNKIEQQNDTQMPCPSGTACSTGDDQLQLDQM